MKIKDLKKYSTAEKIVLAEQLWDSVAKKEIELSDDIKNEIVHDKSLLLSKTLNLPGESEDLSYQQ